MLNPLQQYPPAWGFILASLIIIIIVFYIIMLILTRKIKIVDNVEVISVMDMEKKLSEIKNLYAKRVIEIENLYNEKTITTREAFQKLSIVLREFTSEYSQTNYQTSTLQELEIKQAPPILREQIRKIYPEAFQAAESTQNVNLAVHDTLQVITLWR